MSQDTKQPKMKEFSLTEDELSELSFIAQQERASKEIFNYWGQRIANKFESIKTRLALGPDDHFDFSKLWTDGKLLSFHAPKPIIHPEESNPEPKKHEQELPKKS